MVGSEVEENGRVALELETEKEVNKRKEEDGAWEIYAVMFSDGLKEMDFKNSH